MLKTVVKHLEIWKWKEEVWLCLIFFQVNNRIQNNWNYQNYFLLQLSVSFSSLYTAKFIQFFFRPHSTSHYVQKYMCQ